jgi:diguanylate cyclase (GGDEF)-like protein
MMLSTERSLLLRWLILLPLLALPPLLFWLAGATGQSAWLALSAVPILLGLVFAGPVESGLIFALGACFCLGAGFQAADLPARLTIWFQIVALTLVFVMGLQFRQRDQVQARAHREYLVTLEERLSLGREQYKTDLVVNISNQRKIQKYNMLNRVSRLFASHLELEKLAEVIIQEVQNIIGAERGRYMLAFQPTGRAITVLRSVPEGIEAEAVLDDQFALWVAQHRTALLVADTHKDFRFRGNEAEAAPRAVMVAPLLSDGRVTGILRAESAYTGIFSTDDLRLFTILADLAAVAEENARLYQRTQELAITDGLTGLYLRRFFANRLDEEINRFQEHATPFTLLILDLDRFKDINDRLGHLAGDQVLAQLAETLREEVRSTDIICRFGGEEFSLLLPYTPCRAGMILAERMRSHIEKRIYAASQETLNLTVSIGVSGCPEHADTATGMIQAADRALYAAKRGGRNRVALCGERTP